jgi:hypothetical protein
MRFTHAQVCLLSYARRYSLLLTAIHRTQDQLAYPLFVADYPLFLRLDLFCLLQGPSPYAVP